MEYNYWIECLFYYNFCDRELYIPYTQVNKCMRLFAKLQGNMRLIPNMRLIAKGKIDHTSKTAMASLVARVLDSK